MEDIYHSTNQGGLVGLVELDLRKAFATVNHAILLHTLSYYGIDSTWFKSYLSDITQIAYINGKSFESLYVETGVPQGSILGPLLFLVYLNDLPTFLKYCRVNMHADESAFYTYGHNNISEITHMLKSDLCDVSKWLNANTRSLHISKTSSMLLCTRQKHHHLSQSTLNLSLDNQVVEQVDSYKYIGVTIDQDLSFNIHVENIINKISRCLGTRSSPFLPLASRKTLYNTPVLPHSDYCCILWDVCSDTNISRLQNRDMRIVPE